MTELIEGDFNSTGAETFHERIKKATSRLHILLESNVLLGKIISPSVTTREYCTYLILMQAIYRFYETHLLVLPGNQQRTTTQLIAADLLSAGYVMPQNNLLPAYAIPFEKITIPFAWGFAYVMEGSKLGGKVIFKHIRQNLGFSESCGASFITGYGVNMMMLWKEFLLQFSTYVAENNCEAEAIQGAEYAFKSIYVFFEVNHLTYED